MESLDIESEIEKEAAADVWPLCCYRTEFSPLPLAATVGPRHILCYVNPAFCELVRKDREEIIGLPFAAVVPEETGNSYLACLDQVYLTGKTESAAEQLRSELAATPKYWSYVMWAMTNEEYEAGVMIQVTDATAAATQRLQLTKISEALLLSNVRQHELVELEENARGHLKYEIHEAEHRTKNSLQAISSLINLQLCKDPTTIPAVELTKIQVHIKTVAAMHDFFAHALLDDPPTNQLTMSTMLQKLMPLWIKAAAGVQIKWEADEIEIPLKHVMPLATVINELLCNAIKHGGNMISLQLFGFGYNGTLEVRDNGAGFPKDFSLKTAAGFGLKFVESVSRQELSGQFTFDNQLEGGAHLKITFPLLSARY